MWEQEYASKVVFPIEQDILIRSQHISERYSIRKIGNSTTLLIYFLTN